MTSEAHTGTNCGIHADLPLGQLGERGRSLQRIASCGARNDDLLNRTRDDRSERVRYRIERNEEHGSLSSRQDISRDERAHHPHR